MMRMIAAAALDLAKLWRAARRLRAERRALAALEPRLLRDIGVSKAEAEAEAARPVWSRPASDGAEGRAAPHSGPAPRLRGETAYRLSQNALRRKHDA